MASDTARNVTRLSSAFTAILRSLPPSEREKLLEKHVEHLQRLLDDALESVESMGPISVGRRPRVSNPPRGSAIPGSGTEMRSIREAVEHSDSSTVPGAIRAVLATETIGLLPRAIIEGVQTLRPGTIDTSVTSALHTMHKRGELAREGFHKNYRYILVPRSRDGQDAPTPASAQGGGTH